MPIAYKLLSKVLGDNTAKMYSTKQKNGNNMKNDILKASFIFKLAITNKSIALTNNTLDEATTFSFWKSFSINPAKIVATINIKQMGIIKDLMIKILIIYLSRHRYGWWSVEIRRELGKGG